MRSPDTAVSVIAVVAGEPEARLRRMTDSLAAQDLDGPVEVIVAAPESDHAALQRVLGVWNRGPVTLVANPGGERSRGLNACIARATGSVIVRVDARSALPTDYLSRVVERLRTDPTVTLVGGHQIATAPAGAGPRARGIARALRHPWLLGGAAYRDPGASGPVDTVYLGAFRGVDAEHLAYDESLIANEDYDLCARVRAAGGTVHLEPGLDVTYEPRATYRGLAAQYRAFGRAKTAYWRARGHGPRGRQRTALVLAGAGAVTGLAVVAVRPPALAVGAVLAGVGYLAADGLGDRRPASPGVRLAAIAAHVVIETAWCVGVVAAVPTLRRSGDVEHALERDAGVGRGHRVDGDAVHDLAAGQ